MVDLGPAQGLGQQGRLFRREAAVDAGAAHIDAAFDRRHVQVRAVGCIGRKTPAMKARRRGDAIRIGRRRVDGATATHAIADRADPARRTRLSECFEKGRAVAPCHVLGRTVDHAPQRGASGLFAEGRPGIERTVIAVAIKEIGQQNHIALTRQALGHGIERGTGPEGIHVEDHTGDFGCRLAARLKQPGPGGSVLGPDRDILLGHVPSPIMPAAEPLPDARVPCPLL